MTFEDVWNKIKAVKLTSVLGAYGNFVVGLMLVGLAISLFYALFFAIAQVVFSVPWQLLVAIVVLVSGVLSCLFFGWGRKSGV